METEIKIKFPKQKVDALTFFLRKKETSVEAELGNALLRLYDKHVPPTVRDYLDESADPNNG